MRPEHFEDAGVAEERGIKGMKFSADIAVVESMGSELYAYFDVKGAAHSDRARRPRRGRRPLASSPARAAGTPRRSWRASTPTSHATPGKPLELVLDTSRIQLFDPNGGRNLTLTDAQKADAPAI